MKTFRKVEKLCNEKIIEKLFSSGQSFISYPIRVVFLPTDISEKNVSTCVLISVSKKRFKRAVKRNLIKRRIREAYRINKELYRLTQQLNIAFIYVSNEINSFADIEKAINKAAKILSDKIVNK